MKMEEKPTKEILEKYNLHYLRIYAREIGAKSPSAKTKTQLIEHILELLNGKIKPYVSTKGRRPKMFLRDELERDPLATLAFQSGKIEKLLYEIEQINNEYKEKVNKTLLKFFEENK